jgi:hypothetical protein
MVIFIVAAVQVVKSVCDARREIMLRIAASHHHSGPAVTVSRSNLPSVLFRKFDEKPGVLLLANTSGFSMID